MTNSQKKIIKKDLSEDPDKTMAIVGLVLAFIMPFVGVIISIIAKSQSKKKGFKNPLASIGIILNAVFMLMIIAFVALMIIFGLFIFDSVKQAQDRDNIRKTDIQYVGKELQGYVSQNGYFPETLDDLKMLDDFDSSKLVDPKGVEYSYEVIPEGCDKKIDCTGYKITATAEVEVNGNNTFTYTNSLTRTSN